MSESPPRSDVLDVEMRDNLALVTLNRPEQGNALCEELMFALKDATGWLVCQPQLRGVVITGAGGTFCVGADLREHQAILDSGQRLTPEEYWQRWQLPLTSIVRSLQELRCPVIGAVNGQAAGAGFALALACDIRIAARRAAFNFAYGGIGASTDAGMSWFLPRIVGHARAVELLMEQPVLRAPAARDAGLVNRVVEEGAFLAAVWEYAEELAAKAPHAVRNAKRLVRSGWQMPLEEFLAAEADVFVAGLYTDDIRRGIAARLTGEWPVFTGR
ncbi:enoyl-CoA hydratase/isomerase family protein [Streptomyces sp. NPDC059651]|uniref:enoyl-CoA hydratase/isomerase family protein n=1 Tax=Streptomyces sp. NPDC059651 TaxID=3346897 RepID=UPI0036BCADDA